MACPPVGNGSCYNPKFKTTISPGNPTGFNYLYNFEKVFDNSTTLTWSYVIGTDKIVKYRVKRITKLSGGGTSVSKPIDYNNLQEFADNPPVVSFNPFDNSRETISKIVNTIKAEMNRILNSNLAIRDQGRTPKSQNRTSNNPRNNSQSNQGTSSSQARSTSTSQGATGPARTTATSASTSQNAPAVAQTGSGATGPINSLQDSGYLNTSSPKNFPLIDQPNGTYKPLSDVSRFVFDGSKVSETYAIKPEEGVRIDSNGKIQYSSNNRKYFGANVAVLSKLESVDFKAGFDKQDYIAYLIPYGTPTVASNPTQTVSTQVPSNNDVQIGPNLIPGAKAPAGDGQKVFEKNKEGFNLFKSAMIVMTLQDDPTKKVSDLDKIYTAQWNQLIQDKNFNQIIESISLVYDTKNYKSFKADILKYKLTPQPESSKYQKIISSLKNDFKSLEKKNANDDTKFKQDLDTSQITTSDIISTGLKISTPGDENIKFAKNVIFQNNPNISPEDLYYKGTNPNIEIKPSSFTFTGKSADPVPPTGKDAGIIGVDPSLKIWQFLYNPQSITIDVKADYAESNTWGATDDGQSGQSVLWQRNRNPTMRLDEVVLNGFIHGKKVAQLEEGLFALLMSRDGPGQIQPTVWEFVWGKRRFGPCIINDIQVVEKQWEAGEVLTATVSFTLTQIPKWQVIDSTVKFYDPTAMGTFAEPESGQGGGNNQDSTGTQAAAEGGDQTGSTNADSAGNGGQGDPCRATFNSVIDSAKSKNLSSYLFTCSKKTNPPIDLYKETTEKSVDSILNRLDAQCNAFNGGKTPIISTDAQGKEYKFQGRATLLAALNEKNNCINRNKLKGKDVTPKKASDLLKLANDGAGFSGFSLPDNERFIQYYDSVYKQVSNNFQIDDLAKQIDTNALIIFGSNNWKTASNQRKCRTKTIRDKYINDIRGGLVNETRRCHQQMWLVILQRMSEKNISFDSSISKTTTNVDIYLEVFFSKSVPKLISAQFGSGTIKKYSIPGLELK